MQDRGLIDVFGGGTTKKQAGDRTDRLIDVRRPVKRC
jgi:hypothetical protein